MSALPSWVPIALRALNREMPAHEETAPCQWRPDEKCAVRPAQVTRSTHISVNPAKRLAQKDPPTSDDMVLVRCRRRPSSGHTQRPFRGTTSAQALPLLKHLTATRHPHPPCRWLLPPAMCWIVGRPAHRQGVGRAVLSGEVFLFPCAFPHERRPQAFGGMNCLPYGCWRLTDGS